MNERLRQHYHDLEAAIVANGKAAGIFDATTTKGNAREFIVNAFLKTHLPRRLDVGSGEVIDSQGGTSGQLDTILRDNQSLGWGIGGEALVPVEAAPGVMEIKSTLAGGGLKDALRKVARIKKLPRLGHGGFYETPGDTDGMPARTDIPPSRTKCYVIAYDAPKWETIKKAMTDHPEWFEGDYVTVGPEAIAVLGRGLIAKRDEIFRSDETVDATVVEEVPGLEAISMHINEVVRRYGGLTYNLAGYMQED